MAHFFLSRTQTRGGRRIRQGYILAAVLGMTAVITALGISYLESVSTTMPESMNRLGSMRALYLAESGVAIGTRFLQKPPTSVPLSGYWPGANDIAVDSSADRVDVSITQPSSGNRNLFRIVSTGRAYGPVGESRGKRKITTEVVIPPTGKWYFAQAQIGTAANYTVSSKTTINGAVHGNGNLGGLGFCNGAVSATLAASWLGSGPPTSITSLAPAISVPGTNVAKYTNYTIRGVNYTAYAYTGITLDAASSATLNAINMSATNPGRIIVVPTGVFKIKKDADLNGTLVVNGNLEVDQGGWRRVRAVSEFPALVVNGDIVMASHTANLQVEGDVICSGKFDSTKDSVAATILGTVITSTGATLSGLGGSLTITYDSNRAYLWDFDNPPANKPFTVLTWDEE